MVPSPMHLYISCRDKSCYFEWVKNSWIYLQTKMRKCSAGHPLKTSMNNTRCKPIIRIAFYFKICKWNGWKWLVESRIENRRPYLFHPEGNMVTAMSQSSVLSCGSFFPSSFGWLWFPRIHSELTRHSPAPSHTHLWQIWNDNFSVFVCLSLCLKHCWCFTPYCPYCICTVSEDVCPRAMCHMTERDV